MADSLEDKSDGDCDRLLDSNGFLNEKFEIFTHDYREKKEVHTCAEHGRSNTCTESSESLPYKKKDLVNTTRKLHRALVTLKAMKGNEAISDMLTKIEEINQNLINAIKINDSEFSTLTIDLPDFDETDMELFLGKEELPPTIPMLEKVAQGQRANIDKVAKLLAEADIMLIEYDHFKKALSS